MHVGTGSVETRIGQDQAREILWQGIAAEDVQGKRVLVLTPDATRTAPLPMMLRLINERIGSKAARLDFMVALGTHQPMTDEEIRDLYGVTLEERETEFADVGFLNHRWDLPETLVTIGRISGREISEMTDGLFGQGVDVVINKAALEYDLILVLGPVFPHEVAGFSGGYKYLFPGISGGDFLHYTHWLGAVVTCWDTIGIKDTPTRRAINRAAALVPTKCKLAAMVVRSDGTVHGSMAGLYVGDVDDAWSAATDLSRQIHIRYVDKPYKTVLGTASTMYDEIWVGGKVMYKLEPVVADGGTLIIYGKHITEVSRTWGEAISKVGYHTRDYFLGRMDQFQGHSHGCAGAFNARARGRDISRTAWSVRASTSFWRPPFPGKSAIPSTSATWTRIPSIWTTTGTGRMKESSLWKRPERFFTGSRATSEINERRG